MITLICVLENIPVYFLFEPLEKVGKVSWFCHVKLSFYVLPIWGAFLWLETILTPFLAFMLIVMFNGMTIRHIILANGVRKKMRGSWSDKKQTDQEIENRRKSIILLLTISGSFIMLWAVSFACVISLHFTDNQLLKSGDKGAFRIAENIGYKLRFLSTCTNAFIYGASQKTFREELKNMMKRPLSAFANIFQ